MTSTVGIWPGYLGGVAGFRSEVSDQTHRALTLSVPALLGAALGSVLLFTTSEHTFAAVVPYLVFAACLLFAVQPLVSRVVRGHATIGAASPAPAPAAAAGAGTDVGAVESAPRSWRSVAGHAGTFAGSVYGGYFGAGLGVVLLALLGLTLPDELMRTNGLRTVLSLVVNTAAALIFIVHGDIAWGDAGLLALTSLVGGYFGARVARRLPPVVFRVLVLGLGLATAIRLLVG
jgi:hypothetical protein